MCSIEQRIAEIGRAIDELALKAGMPADGAAPERAQPVGSARNGAASRGAAKFGAASRGAASRGAAHAQGSASEGTLEGVQPAGRAAPAAPADGEASVDAEKTAVAIEPDDSSRIVARLAELWGLLAELDPEVARRLAGYQALLSPAGAPRAA
jgi:hypothetical protein